MYLEFVMHGADEGTVEEAKARTVIVEIDDSQDPDVFIQKVLSDPLVEDHIAAAHRLEGTPPPESSVYADKVEATPRHVATRVHFETRDVGGFRSIVNKSGEANFMTYRLANHIVDLLNPELKAFPDTSMRDDREIAAIEDLREALNSVPNQSNLPLVVQNQVRDLNHSLSSRLKEYEKPPLKERNRNRDVQYLRAAIDHGSKVGDLKFQDRSVDIELDPRSVLCDTDGTALPFFRQRVGEILAAHFPTDYNKSVEITDRLNYDVMDPSHDRHKKQALRVVFDQTNEIRMQRALQQVLEELSMDDEPGIIIRGSGNAEITQRIRETPKTGIEPTVRFQQQYPAFVSNLLHDGKSDTLSYSTNRDKHDLLVEARAFVREHAQKYEGEYREWREKVDPMMKNAPVPSGPVI